MTTHQRPTISLIHLTFLHLLLVLLLSWAGGSLAFAAGEIQVDSANPATAEQGTLNLGVTVKGNGFDTGAEVEFFLAGTLDPAGIAVNNVTRKEPRQLVANIDIDIDVDVDLAGSIRSGINDDVQRAEHQTIPPATRANESHFRRWSY